MGYGAMQLAVAGPQVFGPPTDRAAAVAVRGAAVALGITHIDTADFYGRHVTNQLIKEALYPYPDELHIVTKVGEVRDTEGVRQRRRPGRHQPPLAFNEVTQLACRHWWLAHVLSSISPMVRSRQQTTDARVYRFSALPKEATMQRSTSDGTLKAFIAIHPLDPEDASPIIPIRTEARHAKGVRWGVDARTQFDALMERVSPRKDVTFESGTLGDVPGLWVHPASSRSGE